MAQGNVIKKTKDSTSYVRLSMTDYPEAPQIRKNSVHLKEGIKMP